MRTYDIPYVGNPAIAQPLPPLETMDLQQITKTHLRTCAKSNGLVSVCRKCTDKCIYGKKALELMGVITPDTEDKPETKETTKKSTKPFRTPEESLQWYIKAGKQDDPTAYIAEFFGISQRCAKQKVYEFKHRYPDLVKGLPVPVTGYSKKERVPSPKPVEPVKPEEPAAGFTETLRAKLNELIQLQKHYKEEADRYAKLYEGTKDKIDALTMCIDTFSE